MNYMFSLCSLFWEAGYYTKWNVLIAKWALSAWQPDNIEVQTVLFADDLVLWTTGKHFIYMQRQLNRALSIFSIFYTSKTVYSIFILSPVHLRTTLHLKVQGTTIHKDYNPKYLQRRCARFVMGNNTLVHGETEKNPTSSIGETRRAAAPPQCQISIDWDPHRPWLGRSLPPHKAKSQSIDPAPEAPPTKLSNPPPNVNIHLHPFFPSTAKALELPPRWSPIPQIIQ